MNLLKDHREYLGLSQTDMAKESKISLHRYRNIENGNSDPNVFEALRISKMLNMKVEDLFREDRECEG